MMIIKKSNTFKIVLSLLMLTLNFNFIIPKEKSDYHIQLERAKKLYKDKKYERCINQIGKLLNSMNNIKTDKKIEKIIEVAELLQNKCIYKSIEKRFEKEKNDYFSAMLELDKLEKRLIDSPIGDDRKLLKKVLKLKKRIVESTKPPENKHKKKSNVMIFANGTFSNVSHLLLTEGAWEIGTNLADVYQDFSITSKGADPDNRMLIPGFSIGVFFSKYFGILSSINYIKDTFLFNSDFSLSCKWLSGPDEGETLYERRHWDDIGRVSIIPISLNLFLHTGNLDKKKFNIFCFAGPTVYFRSINMKSHIGLGLVDPGHIFDYFTFEFEIKENDMLFSWNFGIDLEYIILKNIGLCLGYQKFYIPRINYNWKLIPGSHYGEYGKINVDDADEWDVFKILTCNFDNKISHFYIGIRIYL